MDCLARADGGESKASATHIPCQVEGLSFSGAASKLPPGVLVPSFRQASCHFNLISPNRNGGGGGGKWVMGPQHILPV